MVPSAPVRTTLPALLGRCLQLGPAAVLALSGTTVRAAPANDDPIAAWLADRTVLATPAAPWVQGMRDRAADLVIAALNFLDLPYQRGGSDAAVGFDCSGFTRHLFAQRLGLTLPRRVDEQAYAAGLEPVQRSDLLPGDLVFFNTLKRTFSHVGIYVGDGKFIHAPRSGSLVRIEDMRYAYWSQRFTGARRAAQAQWPADLGPSPSAN